MAGISNLEGWQRENVERACNEAIREALFFGLDADELRKMMAYCWHEVVAEKAEIGRLAFLRGE